MPRRPIKSKKEEYQENDLLENIHEDELEEVLEDDDDITDEEEEYEESDEDEDGDEEEYDEDEDDEEYEERSRLIPIVVTIAALAAFVSLGWYAYTSGSETMQEEELVLIEAEQTPMKERPLEPGGMQFPYQDKSVFETITAQGNAPESANVVSGVEEPLVIEPQATTSAPLAPIAAETAPTAPTTPTADAALVVPPSEESAGALASAAPTESVTVGDSPVAAPAVPAEATSAASTTAAASAPAAAVVEQKEMPLVKEAEPAPVAAKPTPAPVAAAKPAPSAGSSKGSDSIQLGAFRGEAEAAGLWNKLKAQNSALSGLSPNIVRADLGDKGIYYRLRVEGVNAQAVCAALTASGQACMKVK